jgi:phage-related protein
MPAMELGTAMKLLHSSNARAAETKEEPLAKDILLNLREIKKLEKELEKHIITKDEKMQKKVEDSIQSIKNHLNEQGVTEDTISDEIQSTQQMVMDNIELFMKNEINEMSDNTISEVVRMMNSGKNISGEDVSKDQEETIMRAMSTTLSKSGLKKSDDIKSVINYLKNIKTDVLVTSETISDMVMMNKTLNNHLVHLTKGNETNAYVIADGLANLSEAEFQMLISMEELPAHTIEAIKIEDRRRKLKDYPFGAKLLEIEDSFGKFGKKWQKWGNAMKDPLGFIKPMFQTVGKMMSLIFKTIIPTIISMAVSLFTVILPIALLIIGVIFVILFLIYAFYTGFWKAFKQLGSVIWNLLLAYLKFVWEHPVVGTIITLLGGLVAWKTAEMAWNAANRVAFGVARLIMGKEWATENAEKWAKFKLWDGLKWAAHRTWLGIQWIGQKAWHIAQGAAGLMKGLIRFIPMIFTWLAGPGLTMLGSILAAVPVIGWIILAIGVIVGFVWFFRKEIWGFIKMVLGWIWDGLKFAWNFVYDTVIGIWDWAVGLWDTLGTPMKVLLGIMISPVLFALAPLIIAIAVITAPIAAIYLLVKYWEPIINWVKATLEKAWNFLTSLPSALMEGFTNALSGIGDALNPFNWFADGGVVTGPTKAVIGESGPEAVLPLEGKGKTTLTSLLTDFFNEFLKPVVDYVMNTLKDLINIIVGGIEKVFNIVEKVFNFVFDIFKPYMPILQSVLDAIYSVVYSIISGLAQLPSWLGGEFFASMLSSMAPPKKGGGGGGKATDDGTLLLSMLSGTISDEPVLGVVGQNKSEITKFDSSKIPMYPSTLTQLGRYIANASQSIEVPEYAKNLQEGIREIGDSIDEVANKLSSMENNILGAVGNSGSKAVTQDKQLELAKLMGRNSYNGGKV